MVRISQPSKTEPSSGVRGLTGIVLLFHLPRKISGENKQSGNKSHPDFHLKRLQVLKTRSLKSIKGALDTVGCERKAKSDYTVIRYLSIPAHQSDTLVHVELGEEIGV